MADIDLRGKNTHVWTENMEDYHVQEKLFIDQTNQNEITCNSLHKYPTYKTTMDILRVHQAEKFFNCFDLLFTLILWENLVRKILTGSLKI